jgi:hypothetical protein
MMGPATYAHQRIAHNFFDLPNSASRCGILICAPILMSVRERRGISSRRLL